MAAKGRTDSFHKLCCFDLLHAGHVTYREGRQYDMVTVRLFGSLGPLRETVKRTCPTWVIREQDRARVLAALSAVDAVGLLFDESTPVT